MDIRKYKVFIRAVETGNLTRASEELEYTQSGVSHMMKSLEKEIGFPLLVRRHKGVSPTADGERLLPVLRELLKWNEHLEQITSSIRGMQTGHIRIASFSSIAVQWLPSVIRCFQKNHPHVLIQILEGGIDEIEGWMAEGSVDFSFCSKQLHHPYDWVPLKEDRLLAILPGMDSLEQKRCFPLADFDKQPFIMSSPGFDYDIHHLFQRFGVNPDIRFYSRDDRVIMSMVESDLGYSVLPELVTLGHGRNILTLELDPPSCRSLGIALPSLKEASPAAMRFIEYAKMLLVEF